jgi:hypothetical protein
MADYHEIVDALSYTTPSIDGYGLCIRPTAGLDVKRVRKEKKR